MFHFGVAYGAAKMALAACGMPYTVVTPAKWKAAVGVLKGAHKEASRQRAHSYFPIRLQTCIGLTRRMKFRL
jgi:hypothetical protein